MRASAKWRGITRQLFAAWRYLQERTLAACPTRLCVVFDSVVHRSQRFKFYTAVVKQFAERQSTVCWQNMLAYESRNCIHAYTLQLYCICLGKSSKSIGHSGSMDSLSKVQILSFMKQQQQTNTAFLVFPKSSWSFFAGDGFAGAQSKDSAMLSLEYETFLQTALSFWRSILLAASWMQFSLQETSEKHFLA